MLILLIKDAHSVCVCVYTSVNLLQINIIGLAAFYAWARAKHFGCHSVCLSVIMGIHFQVFKLEHCILYSHYSFSIDVKSLFVS